MKKLCALLLVVVMVLLIASCGESNTGTATTVDTSSNLTDTVAADVTTEPSDIETTAAESTTEAVPGETTAPDVTENAEQTDTTQTPESTAEPVDTTVPVTTAPVTTAPVTTAPVTTAPVTTAPVTTAPVTTTTPVTTTAAPVTTEAPEPTVSDPNEESYNNALTLIKSGDYQTAYWTLKSLGNYKDAQDLLKHFLYVVAVEYVNNPAYSTPMSFITEFDSNNLPIKKSSTDSNIFYTYTYDSQGNLTESLYVEYFFGVTNKYTYDANGNLFKNESYGDTSSTVTQYSYDVSGRLEFISTDKYDYGELIDISLGTPSYDSNGNMTKVEYVVTNQGVLTGGRPYYHTSTNYKYDANGNLIEKSGDDSGYWYEYEYQYDSNGNVSRCVYTDSYGSKITTDYTYKLVYIPLDLNKLSESSKNKLSDSVGISFEN